MNTSLDHLPIDLMTSKGIPRRRYSNVPPIWMLWPLRLGKLAVQEMSVMCLVTSFLDNGRRPFLCFHAKRCAESSAELIRR